MLTDFQNSVIATLSSDRKKISFDVKLTEYLLKCKCHETTYNVKKNGSFINVL